MSSKFKIDQPKIPANLASANFQDIYYNDEPYLNDCLITNCYIDILKDALSGLKRQRTVLFLLW